MYLSYSGYTVFEECLAKYFRQYIAQEKPSVPDNKVHMLFGDVVGKIFEDFYAKKIYTSPNIQQSLLSLVLPTMERVVEAEIAKGGTFDWEEDRLKEGNRSFVEVEQEIRKIIPKALKGIKHFGLLGTDVATELKLDTYIDDQLLAGRADFVMTRYREKDLILFDGKGTRWGDKFTSDRQLKWYTMLYRAKYKKIPSKIGFFYWRAEPEECLSLTPVKIPEVDAVQRAAVLAAKKIHALSNGLASKPKGVQLTVLEIESIRKNFPPSAGDNCRLCQFKVDCPEGKRILSKESKELLKQDMTYDIEEGGFSL